MSLAHEPVDQVASNESCSPSNQDLLTLVVWQLDCFQQRWGPTGGQGLRRENLTICHQSGCGFRQSVHRFLTLGVWCFRYFTHVALLGGLVES